MNLTVRLGAPGLAVGLLLGACALLPTQDDEPADPVPRSGPASTSPVPDGTSTLVKGSGTVRTEQRSVAGFDRVSISGAADLIIEQADEESLSVEAEDNLLPLLVSAVSGGLLRLGIRPGTSITYTRPMVFRLKVKSLRELEASGGGRVDASRLDVPELRVAISGTVNAAFAGSAETQVLVTSGTGRFDGRGLRGRKGSVDASGTGEVIVNVSEELDVRVSGTATIRHLGSPRLDQQISGLGKVEPLN